MTETPASPEPTNADISDEELDRDALHDDPTDPEATGAPVAGDLGPQEDAAPTSAASSSPDEQEPEETTLPVPGGGLLTTQVHPQQDGAAE